jgi:toxin-antitoxin system PIN domain toxin
MRSSHFPDVNVWLALTAQAHPHHKAARAWLEHGPAPELAFCRFTQIGLLRLITNAAVMRADVLSQDAAWEVYLGWLREYGARFHAEPFGPELDEAFRTYSAGRTPSTKVWADAYLAAFAETAGLTLVTFDTGFRNMGLPRVRVLTGM